MADNDSNILRKLQQHNVRPPACAFDKAWEAIVRRDDATANDPDKTIDVAQSDKKNAFSQLQDYCIAAPNLDFKNVIQKKQPITISRPLLRAASVLLFLLAGSTVYFTVFNKKKKPSDAEYATQVINEQGSRKNDSAVATNITVSNSSNSLPATNTGTHTKKVNAEKVKSSKTKSHRSNDFVNNNDVLFTLVNYKEYGRQKLFSKTLANKKITLNKYSYINLSDKMVDMLQEIYLTKKNGKPARKAKKAKKKFDKWKMKDEKYFDKTTEKNPADIIDLSDFLMNN